MKPWLVKGVAGVLATLAVGAVSLPASAAKPVEKDIWMMGEVHDNPEAHFFRLRDLTRALGGTWRPALLMEQFDTNRQEDLTKAWQTCKTADCVIDMAANKDSTWQWDLYKPLLDLALEYRLPLLAGNLSRAQLQGVMKDGYSAVFDQQIIDKFGLNKPLPTDFVGTQRAAIEEGHCNLLKPETVDNMIKAQVARDVNFAELVDEFQSQGVVLIAGNGHVRRDIGVLQWLSPEVSSRTLVSGYVEPEGADAALFDLMRLVTTHDRPDPCEEFRRNLPKDK